MSKASKTKPPCIAVVDDSRSLALYISSILESLGYATQTFTESRKALEALPRHVPDLILLDMLIRTLFEIKKDGDFQNR